VVVEFSGHAVHNPRDLQAVVERSPLGSQQPLTVIRDGKRVTLQVTVREQPGDYGLASNERRESGASPGEAFQQLGIEVAELTPDTANQLGLSGAHGVVITSVHNGSPADLAGVRPCMVIERVGQKPVQNLDDFRQAMKDQPLAKGVLLLLKSREGVQFVVIKQQ
jgi:serine protease Do